MSLTDADRTTDDEICRVADQERRVVVTKDGDFRDSQTLTGTPRQLLSIMTGNIGNRELLAVVEGNLPVIITVLGEHRCAELSRTHVTGR